MALPAPRYSMLQVVFEEWRELCNIARRARMPVPALFAAVHYNPRRCVGLHLYDIEGPFRPHLLSMRRTVLALFSDPDFGHLLRHWHYAATSMPFVSIKLLSYQGCILDQTRRGPYPWIDPGNFVYSLFWQLLGFAASFVMGRQNERPEIHGAALVLKDVQEYVKARWPRADGSAQLAEVHGDLFEMALAFGYLDNRFMPLVRMLSVPICHVRDIVSYVETQGPEDRTRDITATSPLSRPKAQHVTAMANTLWNAGQVQHYRIGAAHGKYPGYVEFARRVSLMYR